VRTRDVVKGRYHHRFQLKIPVEFTRWDPKNHVFGFATDISVGGTFVETAFPAPLDSDVVVRLWPPGWAEELLLAGVVRRTSNRGMGIQFRSVGPREALAIHRLVIEWRNRKSPRTSAA
jgi:hypothetical protein